MLHTRGGDDDDDGNGMKGGGNKAPKYYWADEDGSSASHTKGLSPGNNEHHHKRHRKNVPTPAPTPAPGLPWWLKLLYQLVGGVIGAILLGLFWGVDKVVAIWRGRVLNNPNVTSETMLGSESEDEDDELDTQGLTPQIIFDKGSVDTAVDLLPLKLDGDVDDSLSSTNDDVESATGVQLGDFSLKPPL